MSVLSLENVTLRYAADAGRNTPVLASIDLSIDHDEFVVVIGRSGSGKTSLLNLAAGFVKPSSGRVRLDGAPVAGPGAERAVVFQDDALYPWLTALDNVAFPCACAVFPRRIGFGGREPFSIRSGSAMQPSGMSGNCRAACASVSALPVRLPPARSFC